MAKAITTSCVRTLPVGPNAEPRRHARLELLDLTRRPWHLHIGRTPLVVRPGDRPRPVGRGPAAPTLLGAVAARPVPAGRPLAGRWRAGRGAAQPVRLRRRDRRRHGGGDGGGSPRPAARAAVRGGRDPRRGCLAAAGSRARTRLPPGRGGAGRRVRTSSIAYPATAVPVAQRLLVEIGRTRMVPDADPHLHTRPAGGRGPRARVGAAAPRRLSRARRYRLGACRPPSPT